jgi:hypothetical protein
MTRSPIIAAALLGMLAVAEHNDGRRKVLVLDESSPSEPPTDENFDAARDQAEKAATLQKLEARFVPTRFERNLPRVAVGKQQGERIAQAAGTTIRRERALSSRASARARTEGNQVSIYVDHAAHPFGRMGDVTHDRVRRVRKEELAARHGCKHRPRVEMVPTSQRWLGRTSPAVAVEARDFAGIAAGAMDG